MEMYPFAEDEKGVSFVSPAPTSYEKYLEHVDVNMVSDTPIAFGLHPNAEIDFRTQQSTYRYTQHTQRRSNFPHDPYVLSHPSPICMPALMRILSHFCPCVLLTLPCLSVYVCAMI